MPKESLPMLNDTQLHPITEGLWGETPWQFIATTQQPAAELCTAAFCIVTFQGKLLLVQHGLRGFEFPGGHVDYPETPEEAVRREVREESSAIITNPTFFGYKKVSPPTPVPHRDDPNKTYPFPHSYIPYYFAEANEIVSDESLAADVSATKLVTAHEASTLLAPGHNHDHLIQYLLAKELVRLK